MTTPSELAVRARHDPEAMERLKHQYQPLIAARVMLHMGFWRPEYMEAGQQAVEEAVMSYRSDKGGFTAHLRMVLRNRMIDLRRKEKIDKVVPASSLSEEHHAHAVNTASISAYREEQDVLSRREEIEHFAGELGSLGMTLQDVADSSPRHAATRLACRRVCRYLMERPELMERAKTGRIPAAELSRALDVSLKTLERHRKYLVACAVALSGDYHCIAGYILSGEGEA